MRCVQILARCAVSLVAASFLATTILAAVVVCTPRDALRHTFNVRQLNVDEVSALAFDAGQIPVVLPVLDLPADRVVKDVVKMSFEETVHFALEGNDSMREFSQMLPYGSILLRYGENYQGLAPTVFHDAHCLRRMHEALVRQAGDWHHLAHCFHYLRQAALCRADLTPELGDFMRRNYTEDRSGPVRVCRDFEAVYDSATYNWFAWMKAAPGMNITIH